MRASARRAADGVALDFNREISLSLAHFAHPPRLASQKDDLGRLIAEDEKRWAAESRFPALIAEVFVARRLAEGKDHLDRVNSSSGLLEPAAWPKELESARRWIETAPPAFAIGFTTNRPEPGSIGAASFLGPQILENIPAILIPEMSHRG